MYSTFLIALREGLEAALIIGILVAYLVRSNQRKALPALWTGVSVAVVASLAFGAFLSFTSTQLSKAGEQMFAGTTSLVAVILVTYMVFWMKRIARGLKNELQSKLDYAMPLGKVALISASFFAVAREGLETALFIFSNFKTISTDSSPVVGLILGLAAAVGLGVAIYKQSVKINLGKFFTVTGIALVVIAGGVLSYAVHEFQEFGALPGENSYAWNWENANPTITTLLSGTIGISTTISWLQLFIWAAYLILVLRAYLAPKKAALVKA
jgi:high-affinity iron transporter